MEASAPMGVPSPFIIPRVFPLLDAQLALLAGTPAHAFLRNLRKHLPLCLSSHVVPVSELAIIIAMIPASGLGAVISRKMTKSSKTTRKPTSKIFKSFIITTF